MSIERTAPTGLTIAKLEASIKEDQEERSKLQEQLKPLREKKKENARGKQCN